MAGKHARISSDTELAELKDEDEEAPRLIESSIDRTISHNGVNFARTASTKRTRESETPNLARLASLKHGQSQGKLKKGDNGENSVGRKSWRERLSQGPTPALGRKSEREPPTSQGGGGWFANAQSQQTSLNDRMAQMRANEGTGTRDQDRPSERSPQSMWRRAVPIMKSILPTFRSPQTHRSDSYDTGEPSPMGGKGGVESHLAVRLDPQTDFMDDKGRQRRMRLRACGRKRSPRTLLCGAACLLFLVTWGSYGAAAGVDLAAAARCAECFSLRGLNVSGLCSGTTEVAADLHVDWRSFSSVSVSSARLEAFDAAGELLVTAELGSSTSIKGGSNELALGVTLRWGDAQRSTSRRRRAAWRSSTRGSC